MLTFSQLDEAFDRVWKRDGKPGADGVTTDEYERSGDIKRLAKEVRDGTYRTGEAKTFSLPKKDGDLRRITVLCVRDRIVHCALAKVLGDIAEAHLSDYSFAYRQGRSCKGAVSKLNGAKGQWAVVGDVASYFDNIDQQRLLGFVRDVAGEDIANLVRSCIEPLSAKGIPQGSSLSPVLSNVYLDAFDREMAAQGTFIRYSDNFAFIAKTKESAQNLLDTAAAALARFGLSLNGKSGVFETGDLPYLGETL